MTDDTPVSELASSIPSTPPRLTAVPPGGGRIRRTAVELMDYLDRSPSPYHAVDNVAQMLVGGGFNEVELGADGWPDGQGRHFARKGGALIAWVIGERAAREPAAPFRIVGAHSDSPNLRLKPVFEYPVFGYRQLGVEVYGGALLNSWLDRDLGVSGRLVVRDGNESRTELVVLDEPIARIPQLAIHLDREVNERGVVLDRQLHLPPIMGQGSGATLLSVLCDLAEVSTDEVVGFDLMLHDLSLASFLGIDGEFIVSGRIDNLFSVFAAAQAIAEAAEAEPIRAHVPVLCVFDHEEVGSQSATGASGPLLAQVLERVVLAREGSRVDYLAALSESVCLSADMAHALHPNYPDRHEPISAPLPNHGPVLKLNSSQRYATDATTSAVFRAACDEAQVPMQVFVSRSNMACGSTIGPMLATNLGISTADVGAAMLSMHSAREMCGSDDVVLFRAALEAFYT